MLGRLHKETATLLFAAGLLYAVTPLCGADYAASVLRDQPISYFRFEEPAGTKLHDSATASHGTHTTAAHDLVQAVPGALRTAGAAPNHSAASSAPHLSRRTPSRISSNSIPQFRLSFGFGPRPVARERSALFPKVNLRVPTAITTLFISRTLPNQGDFDLGSPMGMWIRRPGSTKMCLRMWWLLLMPN